MGRKRKRSEKEGRVRLMREGELEREGGKEKKRKW